MKRRSFFLLLTMAIAAQNVVTARADETPLGLKLRLSATKTTWKLKEYPRISVSLVNDSLEPVTLVRSGDGSEVGWRTPIVSWKVFPFERGSKALEERVMLRCGNMNPLEASEIFQLDAGQSQTSPGYIWLDQWKNLKPGRYRLVFFYRNNPELKWRNEAENKPSLMEEVHNSTACSLQSNEIVLTFTR